MNFLNGSFRIGQLFGINIRVHILFVIWIAFRLFSAGAEFQQAAFFLGMLFGIVFLHELGHCFGARSVGGDARDIMMWPLGGLAYAHAPMRPWPQFVTVAAGPFVNVILCLISAGVMYFGTGGAVLPGVNPLNLVLIPMGELTRAIPSWFDMVFLFYHVNLWLLAFNLLPIYPLDGGQLFQSIIWPFVGLQRATLIACYVGIAGCVAFGVWSLKGGGGILLFIALFGGFTCYQRLQMLRYGMVIEDDRFTAYRPRRARRPGLLARFFARRPSTPDDAPHAPVGGSPSPNPNPGAWNAKLDERAREEEELDRILKKVSEQGIHSLSYIERQTLERVSRRRQEEERQFQRDTRL